MRHWARERTLTFDFFIEFLWSLGIQNLAPSYSRAIFHSKGSSVYQESVSS